MCLETRFPVKSCGGWGGPDVHPSYGAPRGEQKVSLRRFSSSCSSSSSSSFSFQRGGADSLARELESLLRNIPGSFTSTVIRIDSRPRSFVNVLFCVFANRRREILKGVQLIQVSICERRIVLWSLSSKGSCNFT